MDNLHRLILTLQPTRTLFDPAAKMARVTVAVQGFAGEGYSFHCGEPLPWPTAEDWKASADYRRAWTEARADLEQGINDVYGRLGAIEIEAAKHKPRPYSERAHAMDDQTRRDDQRASIDR